MNPVNVDCIVAWFWKTTVLNLELRKKAFENKGLRIKLYAMEL